MLKRLSSERIEDEEGGKREENIQRIV